MTAAVPTGGGAAGVVGGGSGRRGGGRFRIVLVWLGLAAAVVATVVVRGQAPTSRPFDTGSASGSGLKALRLLAEAGGAEVEVLDASDLTDRTNLDSVFVPAPETASRAQIRGWEGYVRSGGRLVVGGERAGLTPPTSATSPSLDLLGPDAGCALDELRGLTDLESGVGPLYTVSPKVVACFSDGELAVVTLERRGSGEVVAAPAGWFTNEGLRALHDPFGGDTADNLTDSPVVAMRLLGGIEGHRIGIVTPNWDSVFDGEPHSSLELIRPTVRSALGMGAVALLVAALALGRRLGRPVREPLPVQIAGSELVEAVGELMRRSHAHERAATLVRASVIRDLGTRLGLGSTPAPGQVAQVAAARLGWDEGVVLEALTRPIHDDDALVAVTRQLESLRQEVLHGSSPTTGSTRV